MWKLRLTDCISGEHLHILLARGDRTENAQLILQEKFARKFMLSWLVGKDIMIGAAGILRPTVLGHLTVEICGVASGL